jgi:tetratricopeptide (TPR) repeat protein
MSKLHSHLQEAQKIQPVTADRLDSWKEIAGYLNRDVRTVQRWEETDGLPVYRKSEVRQKGSPVYAYTAEIDAWLRKNPTPKMEAVAAKKSRRLWPASAALAIVAAAALFLWLRSRQAQEMAGVDPKRVVVAAPVNRTGDSSLEGLGRQITDSIDRALRHVGEIKVADTPSGSGSMDYRRLAGLTRSGLVVAGAYYRRGEQIELQWKIVDPWAENQLLCAFDPIRRPAGDPAEAIDQLCQHVAGAVAFQVNPQCDLTVMTPPLLDAFREYQLGNAAYGDNFEDANQHYEKALAIDPEFYMARFMIYHSLANQRKYGQAESQLTLLETAQSRMTVWERCQVRTSRASIQGQLLEALRILRDLLPKCPKLPTSTYLQGVYEIAVNQPDAAVKSLTGIPVDWSPQAGARASPSLLLAQAYHLTGDFKNQLRVATERGARFPDVLNFYGQRAMALAALGRLDEVDRVIDASFAVQVRGGGGTPTTVMEDAVYGLRAEGHREKALAIGEREISWLDARPPGELKGLRLQRGRALYFVGRWEEARKVFQELAREEPQNIEIQGYLGALACRLGNRAEAERIDKDLSMQNPRYRYGRHLYCRARIASLLGQKDKAVELLSEAFAQGYRFSISVHHDPDFEPLRNYPPYQELIRPKG